MPQGDNNRKLSTEQWQSVITEYLTPLPDGTWPGSNMLAAKYGVSQSAVNYHLGRAGVRRSAKEAHAHGKRCKPISRLPPQDEEAPQCACGCGQDVLWNRRKGRWNRYVTGHYHPKHPYHDLEWVEREYIQHGRPVADIAAAFGVSSGSVRKAFIKMGVSLRSQPESLHLSGAVRGAKNPAWKGGVSPERQRLYKTELWRRFCQAVYERDDFTCQRCGAPKGKPKSLHAHHIKPWADNRALRFAPDNLVTLCEKCHRWVHSSQNASRQFLD